VVILTNRLVHLCGRRSDFVSAKSVIQLIDHGTQGA